MTCFGQLVIYLTLSNPKIDESSIRVIELPSLVYPYFQPDVEQEENMQSVVNQAKKWMN